MLILVVRILEGAYIPVKCSSWRLSTGKYYSHSGGSSNNSSSYVYGCTNSTANNYNKEANVSEVHVFFTNKNSVDDKMIWTPFLGHKEMRFLL